jgi:hypothetical protein
MMVCRDSAQHFASIGRIGFFDIARIVRKDSNGKEKLVKLSRTIDVQKPSRYGLPRQTIYWR